MIKHHTWYRSNLIMAAGSPEVAFCTHLESSLPDQWPLSSLASTFSKEQGAQSIGSSSFRCWTALVTGFLGGLSINRLLCNFPFLPPI